MITHVPVPALRHLVGGEASISEGALAVHDPSTGAQIATQPIATVHDVDRAVNAARRASLGWGRTTPGERATALLALADAIDANAERFAQLESLDVGKPITTSRAEIPGISDSLRYYAGAARIPHGTSSGSFVEGLHSRVEREPIGVVGLITPWNYPLLEAIWKIGPALAAGNTLVLKPSENTPLTTQLLFELANEILPSGVANLVLGDRTTGEAIVSHPDIGMVSLTGDVGTGKAVARSAADSLKRVHLELGGKAPVLVLPDADLEFTVSSLVEAGFVNSGQDCTAACRLIVHDDIYEAFAERYVRALDDIKVGAGLDEATTMGPVVSRRQADRIAGFIERADGQVLSRRISVPQEGTFIAPTVVLEPGQDSEIVQNEVFGPVTTLQRSSSAEQMLEWANGVRYGLSASIWTDNLSAAQRLSRELNFGTVWVNTHLWVAPETPFGGFGQSGYGKEQSPMAIDDYSRFKHVMTRERT